MRNITALKENDSNRNRVKIQVCVLCVCVCVCDSQLIFTEKRRQIYGIEIQTRHRDVKIFSFCQTRTTNEIAKFKVKLQNLLFAKQINKNRWLLKSQIYVKARMYSASWIVCLHCMQMHKLNVPATMLQQHV